MIEMQILFHQIMFKPFKFWADYSDNEWGEWTNDLPTNCFEKIEIPKEEKIEKNKLQIFTPIVKQYLNDMTVSPSVSTDQRKQTLMEMMSPKLQRRSSSSNSDGSLTPTSPLMMRKMSFDKFKPIVSPKTIRSRRKS
jgi:hypothetical protein